METTDEDLTVWCGNLPSQVDEELLYELFLQVAPLKKVRIPTDKSGKLMNYGFVTFKHQVSVPYAVDMFNNIQLYDRTIIVRSRNANNPKNQLQQPQQQAPSMNPADLMRLGMGVGMLQPMIQIPMLPMMVPPQQMQGIQHDYHSKERSRHGQHYDKPYRSHSNHRSSSNRSNNRNNNRYRY